MVDKELKAQQEAALKDIQKTYEADGQSEALRRAYKFYGHLGTSWYCNGCECETLFIDDQCCVCGGGAPKEDDSAGKYTVLSYSEDSGRIYSDHVVAKDRLNAFAVAAKQREGESVAFVACMDGHLEEDKQITFPGDSTVFSETVIEQPDVFGEA